LWWYRLKYFLGAAVLALFVIFSIFQIIHSQLTGRVVVVFSKTDAVVSWSGAPLSFLGQVILWCLVATVSFGLFYALVGALRGLKGPSAETRL
jgi:hypothetical protein